jgi:hypothetical protein
MTVRAAVDFAVPLALIRGRVVIEGRNRDTAQVVPVGNGAQQLAGIRVDQAAFAVFDIDIVFISGFSQAPQG